MYLLIEANNLPEAALFLCRPDDGKIEAERRWPIKRDLADNLLLRITDFLKENRLDWPDLTGLGAFAGPAGFTDLRITHALANGLSYSLSLPVVNDGSKDWRRRCWQKLQKGLNQRIVKPDYGQPGSAFKTWRA